MTQLKTLKDFECQCLDGGHCATSYNAVRQEAIKWIKYVSDYKILSETYPDIKARMAQQRMNDGVRLWIKHFFNITEEELK